MMLAALRREAGFLRRDRGGLLWLSFALVLSALSVAFGIAEVREQRATIAELQVEDAADRANAVADKSDWGDAAYYAFHLTYAPPSEFAFAAMGQRDSNPWMHRVRMLALEGQIYEADTRNADFGLIGRFDFAFLAAAIAPLFLILLLYDLRGGERSAGRHDLLVATAGRPGNLWLPRALVRVAALALALLVPLWIGAGLEQSGIAVVAQASVLLVASLLVWWLVVDLVSRVNAAPAMLLAMLVGIWLAMAIVVPALAKSAIEAGEPIPDGGEILLLQREVVNDAWDIPKEETMTPFLASHPEWEPYAQIEQPFEWKWYYAFQQVGDQAAQPLVEEYREARLARDRAAGLVSFLSPTSLVERAFEDLAQTDATAMIAYEDRVRAFHVRLREFYYPLLFREEPYDPALLDGLPEYVPNR